MTDDLTPTLPRIYVNEQVPPGLAAGPTSFVVGRLSPESSLRDVAAHLVEHGIAEDRIHFLRGDDGVAFLDDVGNRFTRMLSDARTDANSELARGGVVVGIFDVEADDIGTTRTALEASGVVQSAYYGKWTNLP